jgi:ABC-type multidrug transport system permease subunit
MRTTLIVARHHLRRLLRRPWLVVFLAAVPLSLVFIESAAFGPAVAAVGMPAVPVLFADQDGTPASRSMEGCVTDGIGKEPVAVTHVPNPDEGMVLFRRGEHAAFIVVPRGFGSGLSQGLPLRIQFYPRPSGGMNSKIAAAVLETCVALANRKPGDPGGIAAASTTVQVQRPAETSPPPDGGFVARIFPGLAIFGLLAISQAMAALLVRDRSRAVRWRLQAAPVPGWSVACGSLMYLTVGLTALLVLIYIAGFALFHLELRNIPTLLALGIGFTLCLAALQLLIGFWARSERGAQAISAGCVMLLALFGGAFVPVADYPGPWRILALGLPTGAAQMGMGLVLAGPSGVWPGLQILTLWIWALVLSAAAVAIYRRPLVKS